ncbi:MAG: hypothetical protein RL518_987 [Pseudomonadota bacterium]|jgi:glycosyltransferase involved in cell wall biosynthesis
MRLGLGLAVKDEERAVGRCLSEIADLFEHITIVDTGSSDRTRSVLIESFGITPKSLPASVEDDHRVIEGKNMALRENSAPWVLMLDADECISRDFVLRLVEFTPPDTCDGLFMKWVNVRDSATFEDYKLFVVRNDPRFRFIDPIHSNLQLSIRAAGGSALWFEDAHVVHLQEKSKADRRAEYPERCAREIAREPDNYRAWWFRGYHFLQANQVDDAMACFVVAARSKSRDFAVECLNSLVVLSEVYARKGEAKKCIDTLFEAQDFYQTVQTDFEVQINYRLKPWLDNALLMASQGNFDSVRAYRFAC